jgi:hypothetical protein
MKNLAVFAVFFIASFAIGATPILIGIALIYAVAWLLSRSTAKVEGMGSTETMRLAITDDRGNTYEYDTRRKDPEVKQQRFDVGRGLNGVFMDFLFTNVDGGQFEISGYELVAAETTRRLAG